MADIYSVYQFNQNLNSYTGFPLSWKSETKSWNWNTSNGLLSTVKNYFFISSVLKLINITLVMLTSLAAYQSPKYFLWYHLATQWTINFILFIVTVIDRITYTEGTSIVFITNYVNRVKHSRKIPPDVHKLISLVALSYGFLIATLSYTVACLFVGLNIDPIFTVTKFALHYYSKEMEFVITFKILRLIFYIYFAHVVFTSTRTMFLATTSFALYRLFFLKDLQLERRPSHASILFYQESYIVLNIMRSFELKITSFVLVTVYSIFILFWNVVIIAIRKKIGLLFMIGMSMICIATIGLHILFAVGCCFYKSSTRILRDWKSAKHLSRYKRKTIGSLPVIALPAGGAGIIDIEIKINYLDNLLGSIVDSIVTVGQIV